jgi:hypothetical protein
LWALRGQPGELLLAMTPFAADAVADELSALGTALLLFGDLGFGARTIDHGV